MWWSIASSSSPCECVCYHQSSMCNCVTRKSPESRSIGVSSPPFLRSSAASEVGAANTALSHTTAQLMEPPDGGTSSQQALLRYIEKNTNHLELCNGYKRKTSVANCERKKNTKTPACVMSANSRSSVCVREQIRFRLFRFLLL